ncbi:MAG: hypothetical protein ACRC1L_14525, partial [Prochlorococcaceae cyanobacterium]
DQPDRSEWSGCAVGAFQSSTDDYFHPIGAHLDPLNLPCLPMVEQIITKSYLGFNGVAEGTKYPGLEATDGMRV